MKPAEVQPYIANQIAGNAALFALGGTPIQFSLFRADEEAKAIIADALRANGVCYEIGPVMREGDGVKPINRFVRTDCAIDVFVGESLTKTHLPTGEDLVDAIISAVCARSPDTDEPIQFIRSASGIAENGYVLHVLRFSAPCRL